MINYILKGHSLAYEVQTIAQVFFQNEHYYLVESVYNDTLTIKSELTNCTSTAILYNKGVEVIRKEMEYKPLNISMREKKRVIKLAIYEALKKYTGYKPMWGMLTGIRPAKTYNELIYRGISEEEAISYFVDKYDVDIKKAKLIKEVAYMERNIIFRNRPKDISLYIGIPFCPSRCLYCSFTSYPIDKYEKKVDLYLDCLIKEMEFISGFLEKYNIINIYIGGGTPTSLNEGRLQRLMVSIKDLFDLSKVKEFCVEAGRPDTINADKLKILKKYGVNRISINPQTMNDKTLVTIGRNHDSKEVVDTFNMARAEGFDNINMDIILGLNGEKCKDVENTMKELLNISPDSITVHTLAVKRASRLKETFEKYMQTNINEMESMIDITSQYTKNLGMKPYYMYRQKNVVGGFENVGYSKDGKEGIYNIEIMEEKQTILAVGAGSTTKMVNGKYEIERIYNVKDVDEYINRIDEMIERKKRIFTFF